VTQLIIALVAIYSAVISTVCLIALGIISNDIRNITRNRR
jgi:hypothetical protein